MANYPQELTDLVEEYLTDGILTSKERQVLMNKAIALGVNADEFDLYLDAQQQKADQVADVAASKKRGKACPFCGGTVPQLADKCPHCGETITPEANEELQEIFDNLEDALVNFKSGKDTAKNKAIVDRYVRKAKMYYENNPKIQKLLYEVQQESLASEKKAANKEKKDDIVKFITHPISLSIIGVLVAIIIWNCLDKGTQGLIAVLLFLAIVFGGIVYIVRAFRH